MRESMGLMGGMLYGMSQPDNGMKQMDWDVLKQRIEELSTQGLVSVEVGLQSDWDCTSGVVWQNGDYISKTDTYVYSASKWATPAAIFTFENGDEIEEAIWKDGDNADDYFKFTTLSDVIRVSEQLGLYEEE